ncbi:MAG TPA: thiamine pyrophosphate-dependent enzyme [Bryobacteraceae bacterium]|nr:thiamine pyrophosphate-dependent enzyme [Bryobacteraceae bacterium]
MRKPSPPRVDRRSFLRGAGAGAAVLATQNSVAQAQQAPAARAAAPVPAAHEVAAETSAPARVEAQTTEHPGADFMIQVLKSLGFEYVCANPGSSFRGLHESVVNFGGNQAPEFITCCHEESSVAMGHGYAKIEGRPLAVFAHGTVGLQHASMAIYNAYCDRVPVYIVLGNNLNAATRRSWVDWVHSVQDAAAMVRDYTKWDDAPASLQAFAESAVRAYKIAMTTPAMPVVLVADAQLQEDPIPEGADLRIPKLRLANPPQGDQQAVAEIARMLVAAENPVIVAGRVARTPVGMERLMELAEILQAAVVDTRLRMNFPTRHPLNQTDRRGPAIRDADLILGLDVSDFYGAVNDISQQLVYSSRRLTKARLVTIQSSDLYVKSNYQESQRYQEVDLSVAADSETTLPALIEAVRALLTADRKRALQERGAKLAEAHRAMFEQARADAGYAWDASPISTGRLCAELWAQIKNEDWCLASSPGFVSNWPFRLWKFDKPYHHIGSSGGAGIGYGAPAAVGAALANRKHGRLTVNIQSDGDLMYAPGVLWTAAHHRVPLLTVMHNNRAYHQEVMQVQIMANQHNRGIDRAYIGTRLDNPEISYAKLAQAFGMHGEGPISDPTDLGPALQRAIEVVRRGQPALVDVVTQPR